MKLRIFVEPQQGASYDDLSAVARATEVLGFDAFFRSDHFVAIDRLGGGLPGPTDAWVTLGALARETSRIRLGTLVSSSTFRWPGLLAITAAQVDAMSAGRLEVGLGTGWFDREHEAYGVPFPPLGERFDRLEEQLEIVTGLWTTPLGESFNYEGKFYRLVDSPALPKPIQQPRPPIIIGGSGLRRTPRVAAQFADELNVSFRSLDHSAEVWRRGQESCTEFGRDPATLILSAAQVICCGRNDAELNRRAEAIGRSLADLRSHGLAGTPEEIREKIALWSEAGATRLYLQFLDLHDLDHLTLLASLL